MSSIVSALAAPETLASAAGGAGGVSAGYGVSLTDLSGFSDALLRAQSGGAGVLEPQAVAAASESMQALFKPLEHINAEAASLHVQAEAAMAATNTQRAWGGNTRPSGAPTCCRRLRKPVNAALPSRANATAPAIHQPKGCCASRAPMSLAARALEVVVMEIARPFSFGAPATCRGSVTEAGVVLKFPASRRAVGVLGPANLPTARLSALADRRKGW